MCKVQYSLNLFINNLLCLLNTDVSANDDDIRVGVAAGVGGTLFVIILVVITIIVAILCYRMTCNQRTPNASTSGTVC